MKRLTFALAALPLIAAAPSPEKPALAPSEIVAAAPAADWVRIAPEDMMVMDLAPDANDPRKGRAARRIVIQLMPAPFSQGWVGNIRKLVAARWFDGVSVNRVQDNYVTQWGDPHGEDPKHAKTLPAGLVTTNAAEYGVYMREMDDPMSLQLKSIADVVEASRGEADSKGRWTIHYWGRDAYARLSGHINGWQIAADSGSVLWPVHCYGMVGVGRGLAPDAGSGAELYTVIGHAPRHLDRNIALVGRVIEGIEHLSSLPRGTEALGFYKTAQERTPITSVRMGNEIAIFPAYEYLSTESGSFASYADARANRRDAFFNVPAGGADICNIPVPVRRVKG